MEKKLRFVADSAIPYMEILRDHADCVFCKASDITPEVVRDADALFVRDVYKRQVNYFAGLIAVLVCNFCKSHYITVTIEGCKVVSVHE